MSFALSFFSGVIVGPLLYVCFRGDSLFGGGAQVP